MLARPALPAFLVLLAALFGVAGCGELTSFTFAERSDEQIIEGSPDLLPIGDGGPLVRLPLRINLERQLDERDADGAKALYLEELDLIITETAIDDDDTDNFDFLDTLTIYVNGDGQERRLLASMDPVPEGEQRLSLEVDDSIDLKPYIEQGLTLEIKATGNQPEDDTSLVAETTIRVQVF